MKIIKPSYEIMSIIDRPAMLKAIELAGRTCYKSEDKITEESASKFVVGLIKRGHEAMIEHSSITVKFVCDRGVSHEIVRHRIASFAQESSRYCNYSSDKFGNEITFIEPCFWKEDSAEYADWSLACSFAESRYFSLIKKGAKPEEARSVLPNSLKTELVVTMNLRAWRHFFNLRAAGKTGRPHPQMLELTVPLLIELKDKLPEVFGDINVCGHDNIYT